MAELVEEVAKALAPHLGKPAEIRHSNTMHTAVFRGDNANGSVMLILEKHKDKLYAVLRIGIESKKKQHVDKIVSSLSQLRALVPINRRPLSKQMTAHYTFRLDPYRGAGKTFQEALEDVWKHRVEKHLAKS